MALNYPTLEYKNVMYNPNNGEMYLDLLQKTWDEWPRGGATTPIIVNKYYVARPDLISLDVFGDDRYGDLICKYNGISNPFDLNEGMAILIPPMDWINTRIQNREIEPSPLLDVDQQTLGGYDSDKRTFRNQAHSPSETLVGDKLPYVIDHTLGIVIY